MASRRSDCILEPELDGIDLQTIRKLTAVRRGASPFYGGTHLLTACDLLIDIVLEHRLESYDVSSFDGGYTITACRICGGPDEYWCSTVEAIGVGFEAFNA